MIAPKTVALSGVACLSIGWLAASLLSPPVARLQARPVPRAGRPTTPSTAADVFSETLRLKLERSTSAPISRRNPFVFGTRERAVASTLTERRAESDEPAAAPAAPVIVAPPYRLAGLAATAGPDGEVRTAVLSDGTTVHLVKVGDRVGGYLVSAIAGDAVTLTDASGAEFVIRLR